MSPFWPPSVNATENLEFYHLHLDLELPTLEIVKQINLKEFGITSPIVAMAIPIDDSQCIGGTKNGDLVAYDIEKKEVKILARLGKIYFLFIRLSL